MNNSYIVTLVINELRLFWLETGGRFTCCEVKLYLRAYIIGLRRYYFVPTEQQRVTQRLVMLGGALRAFGNIINFQMCTYIALSRVSVHRIIYILQAIMQRDNVGILVFFESVVIKQDSAESEKFVFGYAWVWKLKLY